MSGKINSNYDSKRALRNTLFLYVRMFICMLLGFLATRFLLKSLGAAHFGLANVLGSIVGLFSIITSPLSVAAMRFSAVEMGRVNSDSDHAVNKTFYLLLVIYFLLVLAIIVIGVPIALWVFFTRVNIAAADVGIGIAFMLLFMLSLALELMKVPYMALVIANENMSFFSWVSIVDGVLRLVLFVLLRWTSSPLVMYGVALCLISVFNLSVYIWFKSSRYREIRFAWDWEWRKAREIIVFALYQMGGGISGVLYNSGTNIMLHNFFGSPVNAARGLAYQVSISLGSFTQNFLTAVNPQIIKTFSAKDYELSMRLVLRTCKMAFFLCVMASVPCILGTPFLCRIWLGAPPEYTVIFIRLVLIQGMIDSFSHPLMTLISASGKIALYQVVIGGMMILILPVSYVLLRMGYSPDSVFVVAIGCSAVCLPLRLWLVRRVTPLPVGAFVVKVLGPSLLALAVAAACMAGLVRFYPVVNFLSCLLVFLTWFAVWSLCVLYIGMQKIERDYVLNAISSKLERIGLLKTRESDNH